MSKDVKIWWKRREDEALVVVAVWWHMVSWCVGRVVLVNGGQPWLFCRRCVDCYITDSSQWMRSSNLPQWMDILLVRRKDTSSSVVALSGYGFPVCHTTQYLRWYDDCSCQVHEVNVPQAG